MKSIGIIAFPPLAALIFFLSEIESAALWASAVRVGGKSAFGTGSCPGGTLQTEEGEKEGGWHLPVGCKHAARVVLCKYFDLITNGHIISHFNAPFLPNLKIEGTFKPASSRRSRGGAARPGHTSLPHFTCILTRASQTAVLWQEQICHPNIDAISAEMNALGLIPRCNLSRKHDMTEETEQLCPTTAGRVGQGSHRALPESNSRQSQRAEHGHAKLANASMLYNLPLLAVYF